MDDDLCDIGIYACERCGEDTWDKGIITETGTLCLECYKSVRDDEAQKDSKPDNDQLGA